MAWRRIGVLAAGVLLVAGCAATGEAPSTPARSAGPTTASASPSAPAAPAALGIDEVALSEEIAHVHGLVATDADTVVAGTHTGARTVTRAGAVGNAGDQHDLMGMTGEAGTQRLASSGHPGPGSPLPNPIGLITSGDGGATWSPVSLQGRVDFHALAVDGSAAIGYGGGSGLLVSSDGGATWKDGARIQPAALAYSGDRIMATTQSGLQVSTDGGASFRSISDAPVLVLISAGTDGTMLGLDAASVVWSSTDDGRSWVSVGPAVGAQAVAAFADGGGYAIGPTTLFVID